MAKLDHPHILRCYGGNLEGTNPFIVTELCECSLDKVRTLQGCKFVALSPGCRPMPCTAVSMAPFRPGVRTCL